jgi:hypothetical protein
MLLAVNSDVAVALVAAFAVVAAVVAAAGADDVEGAETGWLIEVK